MSRSEGAGPRPAERPVVSVVVPAFNAETTMAETLASLRAQTFRPFEVLVVDDGSTDATAAIAHRAAAEDPRIRVIAQANGGVASARNRGIAEARGTWIATLDADDLWHPEKLARQVAVARGSPLQPVLVYSWSRRIDEEGRALADQGRPRHRGDAFHRLLAFNFLNNASSAMLRADAVREAGGFDVALHAAGAQGAEDIALYLRLAERGAIDVAPGFLTGYRVSAGTMSGDPARMRRSLEMVLEGIEHRRPEIPPRLMALSRALYDLYAAFLSKGAGDYRGCAVLIGRAARRRPGLIAATLADAVLWRIASRRAAHRGSPPFLDLDPMAQSLQQPLGDWPAALRMRAADRAAGVAPRRAPRGGPASEPPAAPGPSLRR